MPIDVSESEFQSRVLDASRDVPVVVDFWAGWCQPCLILGPILERVVSEHGDRVVLAKVDVDANPGLSAAFGIQGIPAVKAFRDGQVVGEFVGVQSEESVRRFVELALPSEVDVLVATAERSAAVGDPEGAEAGFRAVLAEEPAHERAVLGLTELLVDRGDHQEAAGLLDRVPASERARRLRATVELRTAEGADGPLSAAAAAAARGDHRAALESSLEVLRGNGDRDAARALMIRVFDLLGPDDPLTREFRPQLANALF